MQRVARKFDADLIRDAGEVEGRIRAPWPNYQTFMEEVLSDSWAFYHAIFDPKTVDEDVLQIDMDVDPATRPSV